MKLIAFSNSYTKVVSGGDIRFVEIAKRFADVKITVVTSKLGCIFYRNRGFDAENG